MFSNRYGIELVGISSDGDTRLLCAMKFEMLKPNGIPVVQDTIHLGGKLRNKMLNSDMRIGKYTVSVDHLKSLVTNIQKSVHGLIQNDVCPVDRMDFQPYLKITDDRVLTALQEHVVGSNGTVQYLKMCKKLTSSFLDYNAKPLDRIFNMYHGVFFFRIWKKYTNSSEKHTPQDFITTNAYTCIEINAINLILLLKRFRDQNLPELFLPTMLDSQACEKTFRLFRAMGTTQYTKINFTLYELIHMIGRVEVQNDIAYFKLKDTPIEIPNKRNGKTKIYDLPSDKEIDEAIEKAKQEAIKDAALLGISKPESFNISEYQFECSKVIRDMQYTENEDSDDEYSEEERIENDEEMEDDTVQQREETPKETTAEHAEETASAYVSIFDEKGEERLVRKSTYVWMLTEEYDKLSNDRIKRFQKRNKNGAKRKRRVLEQDE